MWRGSPRPGVGPVARWSAVGAGRRGMVESECRESVSISTKSGQPGGN